MYNENHDIRHPSQKKSLARKNSLLGIVADHEGIPRKKLITLCFVNFGWSKRSTKEYLDLLIEFGSLVLDPETDRLYTYTHAQSSKQLTLPDTGIREGSGVS